jgi:hypothetical protein
MSAGSQKSRESLSSRPHCGQSTHAVRCTGTASECMTPWSHRALWSLSVVFVFLWHFARYASHPVG